VDLVACNYESHSRAILDILNEAIVNSTALYDYRPRAPESMVNWFKSKNAANFPVIGAIDGQGALTGFASYGVFRAWPAYKYSVEHSVYVHKDHRGKGIGLALLQKLIAAAAQQQYHVLVGGIDVRNVASIRLHEKIGFVHTGTIKHAAYKFGTWLDLGFWQVILDSPTQPIDG
jgi:L-amino acid N-acyltransferase